jgi:hypothetical protein
MLFTILLTRSRFRIGDPLWSTSGLEYSGFALNLEISGEGNGVDDAEWEERGEGGLFMVLFTEVLLGRRLWRTLGTCSSSGTKEAAVWEGLPASGGRWACDGLGEENGDAKCFTKLFTRSRFR